LRLFFALWPDVPVARQLTQVAQQLTLESGSRRVDPSNFHVTLAFVGEVPAAQLAMLQQIGRSLRAPQCTFTCDSIEFWREANVVVATARAVPPELLDLSTRLSHAIGLPPRRLRVHVTLARKVTQAPVPQAMSAVVWRATNFSLIRSDTGGAESAYTVLDTWSLLDETDNR
jgi:2'-5' RNA ligase